MRIKISGEFSIFSENPVQIKNYKYGFPIYITILINLDIKNIIEGKIGQRRRERPSEAK